MILALVLAAAAASAPATAIDAERAFIVDAQTGGQWTAFRKWAADDAVMFAPLTVNAQQFLKGRADPPVAISWWLSASYVSCDGQYAVNAGPWVNGGGKAMGFFTTVWRNRDGAWRWIYDGGDATGEIKASKAGVKPATASCSGKPAAAADLGASAPNGHKSASGQSADGTLAWSWTIGPKGDRHFVAQLWNGESFDTVIDERIAAGA